MVQWRARYATRVAVRRVVTILVLSLLAWVGMGRAEAGECGLPTLGEAGQAAGSGVLYQSQSAAGAACAGMAGQVGLPGSGGIIVYNFAGCRVDGKELVADYTAAGAIRWPAEGCREAPRSAGSPTGLRGWKFVEACPSDTTWDPITGSCSVECGPGQWNDPENPGQCLNPDKCLGRAALGAGSVPAGSGACSGGCQFAMGDKGISFSFGGAPGFAFTEGWVPTGGQCTADDAAPGPMPEEGICTPLGDGQTACAKPDGRHCYSTPSGKQFCWRPGETGEKTDGPDMQKTDAGPNPIPPNLNLPNGDTLEPKGNPVTTTTTSTTNNHTTTTTTTTNNYSTSFGTDASKGPGQAEGGSDGDGEGEGDGGSATGGDCAGGWVCSGDPIACAQLREANLQRCAIEGGAGEGELASAEEGMGEGIGKLFGGGDGGGGNVLDVLGTSIYQVKQCPPNPNIDMGGWGSIELPLHHICPHLQLLGTLLLGFAYLFAVKVMLE